MKRFASVRIIALAVCFTLLAGIVPSYAVAPAALHADVVPTHATIAGHDLYGLSDAAARAAITSGAVVPSLRSIVAKGKGHTFTFSAKKAVVINVDATLAKAYAVTDTVTPYALTPVLSISSGVVSGWSATIAKKINRSRKSAYRSVKKQRLVLHAEVVGYSVNTSKTSAKLKAALASEIASPGLRAASVSAVVTDLKPKVTRKNITKAILIVLSQFRIKLYKHGKIEKTYPCATGMPAYPTPTGKFRVTGKVKFPTWRNPGSAWARNMPAYITGGANNPLGTRAIYTSASGIRMHGVPASENWSIGHRASHGCLRMHRWDVEDFYPRVPVGITVWIVH
jgi:lipoprotein-anchoring transpeptidase ErfK/SrfK